MTIESFFIGTRMSGKRYGPQSKDMQVSEFIALISPKNEPEKFVLPDFSGLARRIDAQIRNQFIQQKEDDYYRRYRQLSDRWYQAGSISDRNNRSQRFEKVMDESLEFLVYSHDVMPNINPYNLKYDDRVQVSTKGKMYCVALLFHIIARAAYEPVSVGADPTLQRHCKWLKDWINKTLGDHFLEGMMITFALCYPDHFPTLQRLSGELETRDVDTFLADEVRKARQHTEEQVNYHNGRYRLKFEYTHFHQEQFDFLAEMRDLHYRIDRIEQLLQELIDNPVVDFSEAAVAGQWIDEQVQLLETNETKLILP